MKTIKMLGFLLVFVAALTMTISVNAVACSESDNGGTKPPVTINNSSLLVTTASNDFVIRLAELLKKLNFGLGTNSLSVTLDTPSGVCLADGGSAAVTAKYGIVSMSNNAAVVTATVNGVDQPPSKIAAGNVSCGGGWTLSGRNKIAVRTLDMILTNGDYTITVCATQKILFGLLSTKACSSPQQITLNCTPPPPPTPPPTGDEGTPPPPPPPPPPSTGDEGTTPSTGNETSCATVGPFGEIIANKNLCKANGHIEIQFRGNFGDPATLLISGNNFSMQVPVNRAGNSCNYHYNWDPAEGQQAGTYTFTVNNILTFSADLVCE
jgi:hypothetical protein